MSKMGQGLIEAMQEVLDYSEGKTELRTTRLNVTPVRGAFSAEEIKNIRKKLDMTQSVFAIVIGVSKKTVESWESGRYTPDGAARRLISVLQQDPEFPERYDILRRA
ncbi:MAG: helix-turn-helix domain-containing protein [Oscillospiraceae bacterium]|jgi:putative transcriptional regulator|nr:helix-turn-helix domain-containing protein [Oscillospiraceae bacterium]